MCVSVCVGVGMCLVPGTLNKSDSVLATSVKATGRGVACGIASLTQHCFTV